MQESNNSSKVSDDWYMEREREREYRVVLDRETERDRVERERDGVAAGNRANSKSDKT